MTDIRFISFTVKKIIFLIFILGSIYSYAGFVKGLVRDADDQPLPFASVYVKNTSYGGCTNLKGEYFLELNPGKYTLVFSFLGFETIEKELVIPAKGSIVLNVTLKENSALMHEIEIFADNKDRAREIMKNVRDKRKYYLDNLTSYKCKTYIKTSIEKEPLKNQKSDSLQTDTTVSKDMESHLKKEKLNMIESISETNFISPAKFKEIILAHHDYAEVKGNLGKSVSIGMELGEPDIAPKDKFEDNPYILCNDAASFDFNFYKNLIDFPSISQKPFQSPLATNSAINYSFEFLNSFYENGKKIHRLKVKPRFVAEPLFEGEIFIEDSTWALIAVDLSVNALAIQFCKDFRIIQNYIQIDNTYVPVRREIIYTIRDGNHNILGSTRVDHSDYIINNEFPSKFFDNEVKEFDIYAFDKDSAYWNRERPITLQDNEIEFIQKTDSIKEYYTSDEYFAKVDSAFNKINGWFWLTGIGHRNRKQGTEYYISGILEQMNPFGIGGYRHILPGYFNKEFKNNMLLETKGFINYGFSNKDFKEKISVGLTYIPLKFVRTMITIGDYYDMINNYASFEQTFARSNYARTKMFSIAQKMEITNGLFGELTFEFSDQRAINNLILNDWAKYIFGDVNTPIEFDPYTKSEIKLELKYRFNQKYLIKGNKKYIIGTDFPELRFIYRKGIPGLMNSEVNFDYFELGMKDEMQLGRYGSSSYQILTGTFTNKASLRVLEHKYFRGSDRFFFSDPVRSFQLLGVSKNTRDEFFQLNYIHHFEGFMLNKIPLLNRLGLSLAGGGGLLWLGGDPVFSHLEMFGGLEKIIRIKKQLFRISVFAVTSDNNFEKADFTFKFGMNFYNTYTNKWEY